MSRLSHSHILPLGVAVAFSALGFAALFKVFQIFSPQRTSVVTLNISLSGKGNRPIAQSEIWLIRPEVKLLGLTGENGKAKLQVILPKGNIAVVEARGAAFRVTKDLPIPNVDRYDIHVNLDETELNLGLMTLESRTATERNNLAMEKYKGAVQKAHNNEAKLNSRQVRVTISNEQPTLSNQTQLFLTKARQAFQTEAETKRFTLLKNNIAMIELRILRNQKDFMEVILRDSKLKLQGAKLLPIEQINEKLVPNILADAQRWEFDNGEWPKKGNLKSRFWHIRKRPVDTIRLYLNGEPLVTQSSHDATTGLLPESYETGAIWQLAAVGQTGLLVVKSMNASKLNRPVVWQWPEWLMSQKKPEKQGE